MTRRPLTPLQIELIERHRHRYSGRGTITAKAEPIEIAPSRRAAARRKAAENGHATWTDQLDVAGIWQKWNTPRAVARQSLRQEVERDLHKPEAAEPALDADEIYKRWNAPRQPAQQEG